MALIGENFAFFHMPRTGGTYVRHALRIADPEAVEVWPGHCFPSDIPDTPGKLRITILREPEDWARSWKWLREDQQAQLSKGIPKIFLEEDLRVSDIQEHYTKGVDEILWTHDIDVQLPSLLTKLGFDAEKVISSIPPRVRTKGRSRVHE